MGLWIRAKCDPMVFKQLFFEKLRKIAQTPINNMFELQYISLLHNTSPNFLRFCILTIGLSPPPRTSS